MSDGAIHSGDATPFALSLAGVLESLSDGFVAVDSQWTIRHANAAYLRLVAPLFERPEDLIGRELWSAFPDIVASEAGMFYRSVLETREPAARVFFYQPLDRWLEVRAFPSAGGLSIFVRDITERIAAERELAELNRRMREKMAMFDATLSSLPDLVYAFDREARVVFANKVLLEIWGLTLEKAVGRSLFELNYPPDLAVQLDDQLRRVAQTGIPEKGETVYLGPRGTNEIHDYVFHPVFDAEGRVVGVAGTTRLVTTARRDERAARQLAAIVASSDDAIISKDVEGTVTSWNRGAEKLFGYAEEEIVGRSVLAIIPGDREQEERNILARIRSGDQIRHFETTRRHRDGSLIPVSVSISPIRSDAGDVVGISTIARDITEQKRTESALHEAKEAAERANRSKDHFLAVLSHELRTPLTPVLMSVAARQLDPGLPEDLRRDFAMIRRNIELETKLIDDLLDLSRITSGKLSLRLAEIDLNTAVENACEVCLPQIFEKGIRFTRELSPGSLPVEADFARMQQVLWNLLNNAAKFTDEGGTIRVSTGRDGDRAVVTVRDDGIGIAPEVLPRIFDAFEQGGTGVTRQFGGMGLGLAISQALVERHGGEILATSDGPGSGSIFSIRLPLLCGEGNSPGGPAAAPARKTAGTLRILVVEDHADTAFMLQKILERSGHTVRTAGDVASALAAAEEERFDLVVSDVGLPDASGYVLMRSLAERHGFPGVAMSGYGMDEDVRRSLEAGFGAHLVKPVDVGVLEQTIHRLVFDGPASGKT